MIKKQHSSYEITTDKRTVWVNSGNGMCIGRFSAHGFDIHCNMEAQIQYLLDYAHELPFDKSWERFKGSMLVHHKIVIDETWKPIN